MRSRCPVSSVSMTSASILTQLTQSSPWRGPPKENNEHGFAFLKLMTRLRASFQKGGLFQQAPNRHRLGRRPLLRGSFLPIGKRGKAFLSLTTGVPYHLATPDHKDGRGTNGENGGTGMKLN